MFNLSLELHELLLLQDSVKHRRKYIEQCEFEKEFKPLGFTQKEAISLFEELEDKLLNIK